MPNPYPSFPCPKALTTAPNGLRRLMFVCHGNICRSPMAESMMTALLATAGRRDVVVASSATSEEEIGNGIHPGTLAELRRRRVPVIPHRAVRLRREDAWHYDLFIGMDAANVRNMQRILGPEGEGRCCRLLDLDESPRDVADPWYTGDFVQAADDIDHGCRLLLKWL